MLGRETFVNVNKLVLNILESLVKYYRVLRRMHIPYVVILITKGGVFEHEL